MNTGDLAELLAINNLPKYIEQVNQELISSITSSVDSIKKPSLRVVKGAGKRLRPALVVAVALYSGSSIDRKVIQSGAAIELIHIASLVHDDIIDESPTRWGEPTISSKEGVNSAILVGDYLFALANKLGAEVSQGVGFETALTITELCDGQSREVSDQYNLDRTIDRYSQSIHGKTGALTAAACRIGAICGGLDEKDVNAFSRYGEAIGISYQLVDDLLDLVAEEKAMGKPTGNDIKEGTYTLPLILSLQGPSKTKLTQLLKTKSPSITESHEIINILVGDGSIKTTIAEIHKYNALAIKALDYLPSNKIIDGLKILPEQFLKQVSAKNTVLAGLI